MFYSTAPLFDEHKVLLSAFGYGFTSGAALLTMK
jgi:3-oxoacyl-[acyl-carrier-protein] synthase III